MIGYLIKNNCKLMFRSVWTLVIMLLGPMLVIALLSSAFDELLASYEGVDTFTVGYRLTEDSGFDALMEEIKPAALEQGMCFVEYVQGDVQKVMTEQSLAGFVEFSEDHYVVYQSADYELEGDVLAYVLDYAMNEGVNASLGIEADDVVERLTEIPDFMPAVNAMDYYGIIEIVYFCMCGIVCITGVLGSEKKYRIGGRFRCAGLSETRNYFAKYLPLTFVVAVGMGCEAILTSVLFGVHWGDALQSALVILCLILAANAFGLMLYAMSENMAITVIVQFAVVWIMGFLGGSFETYMYSSTAESVKRLSPLYHGNRALVELSCMGNSDYVGSAIGYTLAIAGICSALAIFAGWLRKRGRA